MISSRTGGCFCIAQKCELWLIINDKRHPLDISKDQNTLTELGHIWYADKTMGEFVSFAQNLLPDSLFVITGDHMERFTFAVEQDERVMMSVPCIFYGQGVSKDWFNESSVGSHIQLAGTLVDIVGPAGTEYTSMMPNMFASEIAFNQRLFAEKGKLGGARNNDARISALRKVSAWRVLKGSKIEQ